MNLLLYGPPGSGKGTQADFLGHRFGIPHVSTGDLFREEAKRGTPLGLEAKAYMDRGELIPDDVMIGVIRDRLAQPDTAHGFLLDGFPRTVPQAEALDSMLVEIGKNLDFLLYLHVDIEELVQRLTGRWVCPTCARSYHLVNNPPHEDKLCDRDDTPLIHRDDDTEETARRRSEVFYQRTYPILGFYRNRGLVVEIDGRGSIAEVRERIRRGLAEAVGPAVAPDPTRDAASA